MVLSETLEPESASVGRARRLVAAALAGAGYDDLVDVATLLISEVVTNSLLHAGTAIGLRCQGHGVGVRIEVSDGSPLVPSIRHYDPVATTGRGLALVSSLAASWGVHPHDGGKTLWFDVGGPPAGESPPAPAATADLQRPAEPALVVQLLSAPPALLRATIEQGDALLRELALLALGGELDDALGDGWRLPQFDVNPILAATDPASVGAAPRADLEISLPAGADAAGMERLRLIDRADALAREDRLLSAPALPEIAACRHWLYTQIAEQAGGFPAQRWELPERLEPARVAAVLPAGEHERLRTVTDAIVVADDANRVIFVNEAAGDLLGWAPQTLTGQRLTVLIPPELREAHLAGFSRLQVTGEARILGSAVHVPALRRDGSSIDVALTIHQVAGGGGRTAFCAVLAPTREHSEGGAS